MKILRVLQQDKHIWLRFSILLAAAASAIVLVFMQLSLQSVDNRRSADAIYQFNQQRSIINHIGVLSQYFSHQYHDYGTNLADAKQRSLARASARNELRNLSRQLLLLTENLSSQRALLPEPVAESYFNGPASPYAMANDYADASLKLSQLSIDSPHKLAQNLQQINTLKPQLNSRIEQLVNAHYQFLLEEVSKQPHGHWLAIIVIFVCFALLLNAIVIKPMQRHAAHARDDAAAANRIKNEFLTSVSHEIRTPMHGIIGAGENLAGTHLDERQAEYIRTIISSAESLLDVVNDILGYSSLESGDIHVEILRFNLYELTSDLVQIMNERAQLKELEIILRYEDGVPLEIDGDSSLIRQVLYHLLSNAIKFTEAGYIVVTVDQVKADDTQPPMLKFSVEDTGIGIAQDKQQLIFEQFVQGDGGTKRLFSGTGLGLTIVKKLVALMGGTVKLGSVVGEGSTFSFTLPLDHGEHHSHQGAASNAKILWICDDDNHKVKVLAELGMEGIPVLSYSTGEIIREAEHLEETISVIAIDYFVKSASPINLLQQLSTVKQFEYGRYACITSKRDEQTFNHLLSNGFAGVFCLPADIERFVDFATRPTAKVRKLLTPPSRSGVVTTGNHINNAKILLVEDNRINATLAQDMLHDFGADVVLAENGRIAVDKVRSGELYDLILMDCMMPEMDGFEATRAIRALPQTIGQSLPIIALTANAMAGDKERCLDSGMNAYLSKPVRKKDLQNTLNRWLSHRVPSKPVVKPTTAPTSDPVPQAPKEPELDMDFDNDDTAPWTITGPISSTDNEAEPTDQSEQAKPQISQHSMAPAAADSPPSAASLAESAQPLSRSKVRDPLAGVASLQYLDSAVVAKAKAMMKRRFSTMVEYFLEDTQNYIEQILQGIEDGDYNAIVVPAHTIKSTSRQMGAIVVSDLSKELEALARTEEASLEKIRELAEQLQEQFDLSRIDFNYLLSEAS